SPSEPSKPVSSIFPLHRGHTFDSIFAFALCSAWIASSALSTSSDGLPISLRASLRTWVTSTNGVRCYSTPEPNRAVRLMLTPALLALTPGCQEEADKLYEQCAGFSIDAPLHDLN